MNKATIFIALFLTGCHGGTLGQKPTDAAITDATTLATARAFLEAAGQGDINTLDTLMTDDFVWHNEGDRRVPWIGTWKGKDEVMQTFLPAFGRGLKTTSWTTDYAFASGEQAVFMGSMSADARSTGQNTNTFSWAVRVHVVNGKVKSWNWFEDSFAVSKAYLGVTKPPSKGPTQ